MRDTLWFARWRSRAPLVLLRVTRGWSRGVRDLLRVTSSRSAAVPHGPTGGPAPERWCARPPRCDPQHIGQRVRPPNCKPQHVRHWSAPRPGGPWEVQHARSPGGAEFRPVTHHTGPAAGHPWRVKHRCGPSAGRFQRSWQCAGPSSVSPDTSYKVPRLGKWRSTAPTGRIPARGWPDSDHRKRAPAVAQRRGSQ